MTATTQASGVISPAPYDSLACPSWCTEHLVSPPDALLHRCDLGEVWGATSQCYDEEKLSITLERHDDDGVAGEPYLSFRYSTDGRCVDRVIDLPLPTAGDMLFSALQLLAYGRDDGHRRLRLAG
jgi:hypothetical protein